LGFCRLGLFPKYGPYKAADLDLET